MSQTPALSVRHLTSAYRVGPPTHAATHTVLHDVHLDARPRDFIAVTGPRGAGKTSLLLCLTGLLRPARGRIRWQVPRARIAYVPNGRTYYSFLTVREALDYYAPVTIPSTDRGVLIARTLVRMGLSAHANTHVSALTDAELRRLHLAHAFVARPHALLLDELLTGADTETVHALTTVLHAFTRAGGIVIAAESDPSVLSAIAPTHTIALPSPPYRH